MVSKSLPIAMNGKKRPVIGNNMNTQTKANILRTSPYHVDSKKKKKKLKFIIIINNINELGNEINFFCLTSYTL